MSADRSDTLRGIAFIVSSVSFFALTDAMVKALGPDWHPMQIIFVRTVFAMVLIAWMVRRDGGIATLRVRSRPLHLLRGVVSVFTMIAFTYAFQTLPLAEVQAIGFGAPLLIVLLAVPMLGETIGWRRITAVVVGFLGVLVIVEPGSVTDDPRVLAPLLGTCTYAFGIVLARKLSRTDSNAAILMTVNAIALVASAAAMPFVWHVPTSMGEVWMVVAFGIIGTFGQVFQLQAYRMAPAAVISPFQYVTILWGLALGWFIWGEWPSGTDLLGAGIVVASGLYVLWRETVRTPSVRPVSSPPLDRAAP